MLLIRFIDLFTLSHDGKQNQQVGGMFMWLVALQVLFQYFDVAMWYFEENSLGPKRNE